jgi:hypothetical protein
MSGEWRPEMSSMSVLFLGEGCMTQFFLPVAYVLLGLIYLATAIAMMMSRH